MADFWIKVEKSTPDKAEIFEIAALLDIDPDAVLGKLIRVWSWIDSNSEDGHIKSVTHVLIDRVTNCGGFSKAMKDVGWLGENDVPNFDRHLGENAKKRAKDAERKRKSRSSSKECPQESVTESRPDKIREDKDKEVTNTEGKQIVTKKFNDDDVRFAEWFYQLLLTNNPDHKKPNFQSSTWADAIRLMREIDGKNYNQMSDLAIWTINDSFWKSNILSPAKLRSKWDQLTIKMNDSITNKPKSGKWDNSQDLANEFSNMLSEGDIFNG